MVNKRKLLNRFALLIWLNIFTVNRFGLESVLTSFYIVYLDSKTNYITIFVIFSYKLNLNTKKYLVELTNAYWVFIFTIPFVISVNKLQYSEACIIFVGSAFQRVKSVDHNYYYDSQNVSSNQYLTQHNILLLNSANE